MQNGEFQSSDVVELSSRVRVNGITRPVQDYSIQRQVANVLPSELSTHSGLSQATGSITWGSVDEVDPGKINPWNPSTGWIPKDGDRVTIEITDGVTWWTQFVGQLDGTSGAVGGGMQSELIDGIDQLSAPVNVPAIMGWMPAPDGGNAFRRVSISNAYHTNAAMRAGGFHFTPPAEFGCVLDLPLVGSAWPVKGECVSSYRTTDPAASPPGRVFFTDMTATYRPTVARAATVPVQLTMVRAPGYQDTSFVRATYGTKTVELMNTTSSVLARVNGATVATIVATGARVTQLLMKDGVVTVKADNGQSATAAASIGTTETLTVIGVLAGLGARIRGVQVSHPTAPSHEFKSIGFTPTGNIELGDYYAGCTALPAVNNRAGREVLEEVAAAVLRPYWIDETGVLQNVATQVLINRVPVQTLTTRDDIRALGWESNLRSNRSEVRAKYLWASSSRRNTYSLTVWQEPDSITLGSGDIHEVIVEPPSGEEWVMVDETPTILGIHALDEVNKGIGTLMGGVYTDGVNEVWASMPSTDKLAVSLSKVSAAAWRLIHTAKTLAAGHQVELRTVSETFSGGTTLWPFWWGQLTSIIRAKGRTKWIEKERTPTIAGTVGPAYEHDFGPWATGSGDSTETEIIDQITSFLAELTANPHPMITQLDVGYDPRRQLGDVINIDSPTLLGIKLKCLVVGINNDVGQSYTQSLSVMVLDAQSTFTSYQQFADAWGTTADYNAFATVWGTISSYTDFSADPLKGTS